MVVENEELFEGCKEVMRHLIKEAEGKYIGIIGNSGCLRGVDEYNTINIGFNPFKKDFLLWWTYAEEEGGKLCKFEEQKTFTTLKAAFKEYKKLLKELLPGQNPKRSLYL